jgi:uroporphyrinogen decarboxylase
MNLRETILKAVHINATGIESIHLKKNVGNEIVFWGRSIDTQKMLPSGTVREVKADVRRNLEALAPGGGFVFNTAHNIQAEMPPESIMAMWETLQKFGKY